MNMNMIDNWFGKEKSENKHLKEVCQSKLQLTILLDGSVVSYKSMFVDLVDHNESSGIMIDTLLPKDGDLRLKPKTSVVVKYDFKEMKYEFHAEVIQKIIDDNYPSFIISIPETISADN